MKNEVTAIQGCSEGISRAVEALNASQRLRLEQAMMMDENHHELVATLRDASGKEFTLFIKDVPTGGIEVSAVVTFEDFPEQLIGCATQATDKAAKKADLPITLTKSNTGNLETVLMITREEAVNSMTSILESFAETTAYLEGEFEELLDA